MKVKYETNKRIGIVAAFSALLLAGTNKLEAGTRATYVGADNLVITGRTMDWQDNVKTNLYLFPRGMERSSYDTDEAFTWISKYGSVIAAGYDIGTCDGMNEKGLVVNLLYLPESDYFRPEDTRPVMGMAVWTQYVLDNFATVREAVAELQKESFRLDAPLLPNGMVSTLHMSISDVTGNSAILEYIDGKLIIYEGKEYLVMTNSPRHDLQKAVNNYWQREGVLNILPAMNRSSDRFARASFYIQAIPQTGNAEEAVPVVFSVMRNVSVPLSTVTPDKGHPFFTQWRSVANQRDKVYYFESTLIPAFFWVDLKQVDFSPRAGVKKLPLTNGEIYIGEASGNFEQSQPFAFLFRPE